MDTISKSNLNLDSPAVQMHLEMLQDVIGRLAYNSAACKTWCVTLASALAVVVADKGKPNLLSVAAVPIVIFGILDMYYLGLERRFRNCYETFVKKLHYGTASVDDTFLIGPPLRLRGFFKESFLAAFSFSIWPFYFGLAAVLWFLKSRL